MKIPPLILNWQRREVMMSRLGRAGNLVVVVSRLWDISKVALAMTR
jgi:hypothetical protein